MMTVNVDESDLAEAQCQTRTVAEKATKLALALTGTEWYEQAVELSVIASNARFEVDRLWP